MLYLESPAGVGYSLWNTTDGADYTHNDMTQSVDALKALLAWYDKFPERINNPLYVSGESYGGIYVPYLAWQIYQHNLQSFDVNKVAINLKGFMVGNGATDWDYDVSPSFPEVVYNFQMVPKSLWDTYESNHCKEFFNDFKPWEGDNIPLCQQTLGAMENLTSSLNWYDLYRHVYASPSSVQKDRRGMSIVDGQEKWYNKGRTMREYTPWLKHHTKSSDIVSHDFLSTYVNSQEMRDALHIPSYAPGWE